MLLIIKKTTRLSLKRVVLMCFLSETESIYVETPNKNADIHKTPYCSIKICRQRLLPYKIQEIIEVFKIALDELKKNRLFEFVFGCYHQERS